MLQERIKQIEALPRVVVPEAFTGVFWNESSRRLELRHAGKLETSVSYESLLFIAMKDSEGIRQAVEATSSPLKYVLRMFFYPNEVHSWPTFYVRSDAAKV